MEKNERLAWRTKPRTYCFSSCPKRHCKRETLPNCKLKKNNFSGPEKLFFHFPFQTLLGACVKKFCSKERRLTEATSFYRKGGVVRQRIRKVRSDVGHKRTNYKGKPAKPEHARLLSSCSSGFAAPEPGVMVSTVLDEMSPPKRSKT